MGEAIENDLEWALEQVRHAEGPNEPEDQPSIVWSVGDGASCRSPTPWGQVLDFVLVNSSDLLAEGIGANVGYERIMTELREFRTSGCAGTPSFRAVHELGEPEKVIATAAVAAIVTAATARGLTTPSAEQLLVVDRAVIWTHKMPFYAYVLAAQNGSSFYAEAIVPLDKIRDIGIQTKLYPN